MTGRDRRRIRHAWRCHCLECRFNRAFDRMAIAVVIFAVLYFGAHVLVSLAR